MRQPAKSGLIEPCLILCPFEASISLGEPGRIQGLKSYTGLDRVFDRLQGELRISGDTFEIHVFYQHLYAGDAK